MARLQNAGHSNHGRHNGRKGVDGLGMVPLHMSHNGGATGGNVPFPVVLQRQPAVGLRDQVGAEGDFVHVVEPEGAHHADELLDFDIGKLGGKNSAQ